MSADLMWPLLTIAGGCITLSLLLVPVYWFTEADGVYLAGLTLLAAAALAVIAVAVIALGGAA